MRVGIAIGYGQNDPGVQTPVGGSNFFFSMSSRPKLGPTQPPIQYELGLLPWKKAAGARR